MGCAKCARESYRYYVHIKQNDDDDDDDDGDGSDLILVVVSLLKYIKDHITSNLVESRIVDISYVMGRDI